MYEIGPAPQCWSRAAAGRRRVTSVTDCSSEASRAEEAPHQNGLRPRRLRTDTISPRWPWRWPTASHCRNHADRLARPHGVQPRDGVGSVTPARSAMRALAGGTSSRRVEVGAVQPRRRRVVDGARRTPTSASRSSGGGDVGSSASPRPPARGHGGQPDVGPPAGQQRLAALRRRRLHGQVLVPGGVQHAARRSTSRRRRPAPASASGGTWAAMAWAKRSRRPSCSAVIQARRSTAPAYGPPPPGNSVTPLAP